MSFTSSRFFIVSGIRLVAISLVAHLATTAAVAAQDPTWPPVPGDSTSVFQGEASVTPSPAPIGAPLEFRFTVTNVSQETATLIVDGCPVLYVIDGIYYPIWPCPASFRTIEIGPGQSVVFGPEEDAHLLFDPHEYPLGPGTHEITMAVGVVRGSTTFTIEEPPANLAYAAGHVFLADGRWIGEGGTAVLGRSLPDYCDSTGTEDVARTPVSHQGYFFFTGVEPGSYYLRVELADGAVWWPAKGDPCAAELIGLEGGTYRDGLDFYLGPEPPPVYTLTGIVYEASTEHPLPGAIVLAVPAWPDSGGVVPPPPPLPGDSTGVGADGTIRDSWWGGGLYHAVTDAQGRFEIAVTEGQYRLLAGKPESHRYQYWNHTGMFGDAEILLVPDPRGIPTLEPRFDLALLSGEPAVLSGRVLGQNPLSDAVPQPVAGAEIRAYPIFMTDATRFPSPLATKTGEDGTYRLEVPALSPYLVQAGAVGYDTQFYQNAYDPSSATWIDTAPGVARDGIDFLLNTVSIGGGAIEGIVLRRLLDEECGGTPAGGTDPATGDSCLVPAAGAVVRVVPAFPTFAPVEYRTVAGADGRFRVDGLPAAPDGSLSYYVSAQFEAMEPAYYPGGVPFAEASPLAVFPGGISDTGPIFVPVRGGQESGFVGVVLSDPDGAPIPLALVRVYVEPDSPYGWILRGITDANGAITIGGLPAGAEVLVSAEAHGFVPGYYPGAHRWTLASKVTVSSDNSRVAPVRFALERAFTGGSFIQAGQVRGFTGAVEDSIVPDPGPLSRLMPLTHLDGLPDAFFYLVNAETMGPAERPVAGGSTGENGAVILTGLATGTYVAYADRPGYQRAYFTGGGEEPLLLVLNASTPGVLADIALEPLGGFVPPGEGDAVRTITGLESVPNPSHAETMIRFRLEASAPVALRVFDTGGRLVRTLLDGELRSGGMNQVPWDGTDQRGRRVSPGVYYYQALSGKTAVSARMVVLR